LNTGVPGVPLRTIGIKRLLKMERSRTPKENYLHNFTYNEQEFSFNKAKELMSKHLDFDGSVDLDESINGISKVCLNNPLTKNALNGTVYNLLLLLYYFRIIFICMFQFSITHNYSWEFRKNDA
jgi:hypothetical protein